MDKVELPQSVQDAIKETARSTPHALGAKRVFIAVPNLCQINTGLVAKLFHFASQREYDPWFHFLTEKRHHDYARNLIGRAFLDSKCDYCLMIDDDVDPHPKILTMIEEKKDIIAGNVFCWISGELMSSIWQNAECEQCRVLKVFQETGKNHDVREYLIHDDHIMRWNPFSCAYERFAHKESGILPGLRCRCKGTGFDPFVFRTHQSLVPNTMSVHSVGAAALLVSRKVFEEMPFPWFRFLYRQDGSIMLTEDHYFCWKAAETGFEVWADPRMLCSHYKLVDLLQIQGPIEKAYKLGKQIGERDVIGKQVMFPEPDEMLEIAK